MRDSINFTFHTEFATHTMAVDYEVTGRIKDFNSRDYTAEPHIHVESVKLIETTYHGQYGDVTRRFDSFPQIKRLSSIAYELEEAIRQDALNSVV